MKLGVGALVNFLGVAVFCFGLLALPRVAAAQEDAGIIGQVKNDQGMPIAGVKVTAASPALQTGEMTTVASQQGEYRLSPLTIGTYAVTYTADGFAPVKVEDVRLTVGFVAKLDVVLKKRDLSDGNGLSSEPVTVIRGESRLVDVTASSTQTTETRETLEAVPGSRNLQELLGRASGVREDLDVGGSTAFASASFHAFGQDGQQYQEIESLPVNSFKTGSTGGSTYMDRNAVAETRVQTLGHDADIPTRGIAMNVVMKSGGNTYHGEGFWAQTGNSLESDNLDSTLMAEGVTSGNPVIKRLDLDGQLGGKIIRDKLWFFQATRRRSETNQILGVFQDDGVTPGTNSPAFWYTTQKLSYQANASNRFIFYNQWNHLDSPSGATLLVAWDSRQEQFNQTMANKIEWQAVKGNSLIFSVLTGDAYWHVHNVGFNPGVVTATDLVTLKTTGDSLSDGQHSDERRWVTNATMTWFKPNSFMGSHQIRVGLDHAQGGTIQGYSLRSCTGIACSELDAELVYNNGVPFEVYAYAFPIDPQNEITYTAPYVSDSWTIAHNVTLNAGIRYAHNTASLPAQCRVAAPAPSQIAYPATCFPSEQFATFNPVTPRLHMAWDLTGDGKTVLKGGWGRFAQQWGADQLQQANNNANKYTTYLWHAPAGTTDYLPGSVNLSLNGPGSDFVSEQLLSAQAPALGVPNPDLQDAISHEANVSIEKQLFSNFAVRATGVYDRVQNYLLAGVQRPYSAYNIPVTVPIQGTNGVVPPGNTNGLLTFYVYPASLQGKANSQTIMVNSDQATSSFKSVEFAAIKRLSNRWQLNASYSYTKKNIPLVPSTGSFSAIYLYISQLNPNAQINAADHSSEWIGRASGSYQLPYDLVVSSNFSTRSGNAYAGQMLARAPGTTIPSLLVNVTPIGAYRLPELTLLDWRLEKRFRIPNRQSISLRFNVYNSLNTNAATTITTQYGKNFEIPTAIVPPRIMEFGATYTF